MRKCIALLLCIALALSLSSCKSTVDLSALKPQVLQMRSICQLATMECFYHNVAKFKEENTHWLGKDKHFWVEYSARVTVGIDASLVSISIDGNKISITLPPAKVISAKVDEFSLTEDSFVFAKDSAKISAAEQTAAIAEAQKQLEETVANDETILVNAQQRARALLEDYIENIERLTETTYIVEWIYVNDNGTPISTDTSQSSEVADVLE